MKASEVSWSWSSDEPFINKHKYAHLHKLAFHSWKIHILTFSQQGVNLHKLLGFMRTDFFLYNKMFKKKKKCVS